MSDCAKCISYKDSECKIRYPNWDDDKSVDGDCPEYLSRDDAIATQGCNDYHAKSEEG